MIEEIIYTSAEKGLKAGSRGFCTVVSTAGMAINTAERLESMSGYRHAFPMQDPKAALNPVNFSHVTLRIGGKNAHVISRVADAGQDYSGRTNKLAHHLMLDDVSRMTAGPARLMAEKGVLVSQWDGNVKTVPARKLPMPMIPASIELKAWKQATGDSGWAGWAAEQLTKDKAPVSVIFQPGTDTLLLVREVLDLLPVTQQWSITFCTYFTKLLAGTECQLRFVLHDTPDATALRNDARAKVIDLIGRLPECSGGALVQAARTDQIQAAKPGDGVPTSVSTSSRPQAAIRSDDRQAIVRMSAEIPAIPKATSPEIALTNAADRRVPSLRTFETTPAPPKRSRAMLYSALALALIAIAGVGFAIYANRAANTDAIAKTSLRKPGAQPTTMKFDPVPPPFNGETQEGTQTPTANLSGQASLAQKDTPSAPVELMAQNGSASDQNPLSSGEPIPAPPTVATGEVLEKEIPSTRPDPFQLVTREKEFEYPNHPELLLFEVWNPHTETQGQSLPLVLREGDTVHLAFHQSYHDVIDAPEGLIDTDIRLSERKEKNDEIAWTAELMRDSKVEMDYGEYRLKASVTDPATHVIEFNPGTLHKKRDKRDIPWSSLFAICPLIVQVKASEGSVIDSKVFAQSRGLIRSAEGNRGQKRHSEFPDPNPLQKLRLYSGRDKPMWRLFLDVVHQSADGNKRLSNTILFEGRDARTNLYTALSSKPQEVLFFSEPTEADADAGYVEHSVKFTIEKDENDAGAGFQFLASKATEARLRLPCVPSKATAENSTSDVREILRNSSRGLTNKEWWASLSQLEEANFRLPIDSRRKELFDENARRFLDEIKDAVRAIGVEKTKAEGAIKAQNDMGDKKDQSIIDNNNALVAECLSRTQELESLQNRYSFEEHSRQREILESFFKFDNDRPLGYEVYLELDETRVDEMIHPKTRIYLIETVFEGEQQ